MAEKEEFSTKEMEEADQGILEEDFPHPLKINGEEIVNQSRVHNAWITIGRDRPQGKRSGYGQFPKNKDGNKSSTIDIVVGRYSHKAGTVKNGEDYTRNTVVGNNIQQDAARVYISQKTDIDANFLIQKAGTLVPAVGKAAIGMKSDNLRFVARESVKIVAASGEVNSLGVLEQSARQIYGIQLITGPETEAVDVQSIVKSENLRECLEEIIKKINTLAGTLSDYILFQSDFNTAVASHQHTGHFRSDVAGSVQVLEPLSLIDAITKYSTNTFGKTAINIQSIRTDLSATIPNKYLSKSTNSKKYIGSLYNKTN